jgi:hypothetical protein
MEESSRDMDLTEAIQELCPEEEKPEPAIASLEEIQVVAAAILEQKRRGRKFMSAEERREVSARMKKYWAARGAGRGGL